MRVPVEWLNEFVDVPAGTEEIARRLTMIGLEVEAVDLLDDDDVLEINVTPNRPDCLSIIGIARELAAAYKLPLAFPEHNVLAETGELDFNVDIIDSDLCHRYAGRVVKNVRIGPSPEWLRNRLDKCGIRPINNIVDITNYVLLEFGHPLHAFDLRMIRDHRIRVGTPKSVKGNGTLIKFDTLDGIERRLPEDALLIWDAKRPIAIAGIMGGLETEVSDSTIDIFIESAYFDPMSVRKTSRLLGLKTESSYRFERGTDIKGLKKALDRAAYLMKEIAGGVVNGKIDIYPKIYSPSKIDIKFEEVNSALGLKLSENDIRDCLEGLGLEMEMHADRLKITPPAYRRDLKGKSDILEEIARMYGYDRIPARLPVATIGINGKEPEVRCSECRVKAEIKNSLLKSGYMEAVNYSFLGIQDLDLLGMEPHDERRNLLQVKNPLKTEDAYMRTTLVPALLKNLTHNLAHGNRDVRLFEISRVFMQEVPNSLPTEKEHLAAIYYREKTKSLYKEDIPDFYAVKGIIEAVFNDIRINDYSFVRSVEPFLHPGQSADILVTGNKVGYMGALSPEIVNALDIKANKPSIIIMELDIESIVPYTMQAVKYLPLPKYPYIERDTAMVLDRTIESEAIIKLLRTYPSELIEDAYIFDVFQGKNIPDGKKSVAFNIRYRNPEKTLKDEEIDVLHKAVVDYIIGRTNGQLRQ